MRFKTQQTSKVVSHHDKMRSLISHVPGDKYDTVRVEVQKTGDISGVLISRCDYYQYLKCFCLSFPPSVFPHGVQGLTFYPRNKTHLVSFLVAPANFYDFSRKLNKLELQYGYGYGYIVQYEIYQQYPQSGENSCKQSLSWEEDNCKLEKVSLILQ